MSKRPIILVGLPAVGKTTLANAVHELRPEVAVNDLDLLIEQACGLSAAQIIRTRGESEFRAAEAHVLASLDLVAPSILATGAGVIETPDNLPLLKRLGLVVHLTASPEVILDRITFQKGQRPLAETDTDPRQWLDRLSLRRMPLYRQIADAEFDSSHLESEQEIFDSASRFISQFLLS